MYLNDPKKKFRSLPTYIEAVRCGAGTYSAATNALQASLTVRVMLLCPCLRGR